MNSIVAAIEQAAPVGTSFLPCPAQLELLRDPKTGELPANAIAVVRGRGRPKGALNKRNRKIADIYVQRYGDPLDAIGQLANTPLRQLIEVLMEADGSAAREEKLLEGVEEAVTHIKLLTAIPGDAKSKLEMAEKLADAIERLAKVASSITGKAGKLALDALALQAQMHVKAAEYVHSKQPIAVDVRRQADVVIVAPELLKEFGIDPGELATAIATDGLEAFDAGQLRFGGAAEDAEFSEVEDGGDDQA